MTERKITACINSVYISFSLFRITVDRIDENKKRFSIIESDMDCIAWLLLLMYMYTILCWRGVTPDLVETTFVPSVLCLNSFLMLFEYR